VKDIDLYLEPSAGNGSFYSLLPADKRHGLDLDPKYKGVQKLNFFDYKPSLNYKNICAVGNPPFGKRSKLAIEFFNHAAAFANTIAFIVPVQWQKWGVQSKLPKDWKLTHDEILQPDAFLHNGKSYKVRCTFQIWQKNSTKEDLRLKLKPSTAHEDFDMFLYNNVPAAEKYYNYDWDFAVPRQGYANYSRRETNKAKCEKTTQWIFIKAKSPMAKERLYGMDFAELAKKNTSTPGWGKADLVEEYNKLYCR
jgi:hypothetical protein